MDEKFEIWKADNKEFCDKANQYQIQCAYQTNTIISDLRSFLYKQQKFDVKYQDFDFNRIINRLAHIRNIFRATNKKQK